MYTPKLMLLVFNLVVMVMSILMVIRGATEPNTIAPKIKDLASNTVYNLFPKICIFGGLLTFTIAIFGFWCTDNEHRTGLISYKILMFFIVAVQIILVFFFVADKDKLQHNVVKGLDKARDAYLANNDSKAIDNIQLFFQCNQMPNNTNIYPETSCSPVKPDVKKPPCTRNRIYSENCNNKALNYFKVRQARFQWILLQILFPELATIIFAHMVAKKILVLQNLLDGKLPP